MRMVKVPIDEIVDMIAVRNGRMTAPWSVDVRRIVTRALVSFGATVGVFGINCDLVLVYVVSVRMMQMPVV